MGRPPTIVVDIDGVLATGTVEEVYSNAAGWAYEKCSPILGGIALLVEVKKRASDVRVILFTARWEKDRDKTEAWLSKYEVPYDELRMGKPSADLYIDDRNFPVRFDPGEECIERLFEEIVDSRNGQYADWSFDLSVE